MVSIQVWMKKYVRPAVLGVAVLCLALAPNALAATQAAQPAGPDSGLFVAAWSQLVDFGEWLASSFGVSVASDESSATPTAGLLPEDGQAASCTTECPEDDSGPVLDPNG